MNDRLAEGRMTPEIREAWNNDLARIIAKARFGPGVDMGGAHNPRPSETAAAVRFIDDLLAYLKDGSR